jgi:hypothetical protein
MMLRRSSTKSIAAIAFAACTSCATLFQGTKDEIQFNSDPQGATATVNDGHSGATPYSINVSRNDDLQVQFSRAGYQPQQISDPTQVQWGYVVSDIFFTGLIGLAIDGIDGAMYTHSQHMVSAHLEPLPSAIVSQPSVTTPAVIARDPANDMPSR